MLKVIDRIFGVLLVLAACGHTVGTILWTQPMSGIFIWSLGSSLAAAMVATLNIVRVGRQKDKTPAAITMIVTACWALVAFGFGKSIGNLFDPRPLAHVIISIVLVIFSGVTLWRNADNQHVLGAEPPLRAKEDSEHRQTFKFQGSNQGNVDTLTHSNATKCWKPTLGV